VIGEFEALLLNVAEAEAAPLAPGVNVTVKLIGWLVVTVSGNESPLMENSERLVRSGRRRRPIRSHRLRSGFRSESR